MKKYAPLFIAPFFMAAAACSDGPAENAGENMDEAVELLRLAVQEPSFNPDAVDRVRAHRSGDTKAEVMSTTEADTEYITGIHAPKISVRLA
mgnify:CR=1 FL=1